MPTQGNIIGLTTTGLLLGTVLFSGCGQRPAAGPPPQASPTVSVMIMTPEPVTLTSELPGRTSAHLIAEVRPQIGGIIQKRLFEEGADVKSGQLLYQIDAAPYQAAEASAQALLDRAKSGQAIAKAALTRAEANLVPLRLRAKRFKELVTLNAVSTQDFDDATAAVNQAEAEVQSAQAAILGAAADIGIAEAAIATAQINLAYTQVKASISGRIGKSAVTIGALVTGNQADALATIQQLDPIYVDLTQSGAERLKLVQNLTSGLLQKGGDAEQARIRLMLEDGSAYQPEGVLKFSDATIDPSTGGVILRALFPNPTQLLLPGMFVRGIVQEGIREQALLVPQRAVTRNPSGEAMVMIVGADDKIESRIIQVERTIGDDWLVNSGLQAGDRVVMEGTQRARPGTQVNVILFTGKPASVPVGAPQPSGSSK